MPNVGRRQKLAQTYVVGSASAVDEHFRDSWMRSHIFNYISDFRMVGLVMGAESQDAGRICSAGGPENATSTKLHSTALLAFELFFARVFTTTVVKSNTYHRWCLLDRIVLGADFFFLRWEIWLGGRAYVTQIHRYRRT